MKSIRGLVEEGQKRALALLKDNLDKLHKLAEALLERETMTAQEVYDLLEMEMPEHAAESDDDFGPEDAAAKDDGPKMAAPPLEPEDNPPTPPDKPNPPPPPIH